MKTLIALLIMTAPALANMPPKEFDHATNRMSIAQIKATYTGTVKLKYKPVPFGEAPKLCPGATYGCFNPRTHVVVYSYDPTGRDPVMDKNSLRHEIGHANGWPKNHPNALP